jgi:S1-C subfamily serine protease
MVRSIEIKDDDPKQVSTHVGRNARQSTPASLKTLLNPIPTQITTLPQRLTMKSTGLSKNDLTLLRKKQRWLSTYRPSTPNKTHKLEDAVSATLVFAQEEAGTAICISSAGLLLTCSHCIAESLEDLKKEYWLLFASGQVVQAKYLTWEPGPDLGLLQIIAVQGQHNSKEAPTFASINIANRPPKTGALLVCIGHPGSEDLEASIPRIKTNYDVLYVSEGRFRGYAKGQDLQDNSEIGALKHDCWTYWGHSGAPLIDAATGKLVGLHSSWDETTGMRRGIALEAIQQHLKTHSDNLRKDELDIVDINVSNVDCA